MVMSSMEHRLRSNATYLLLESRHNIGVWLALGTFCNWMFDLGVVFALGHNLPFSKWRFCYLI